MKKAKTDKQLFITQNVEHSARGYSGISKWEESGLDQWRQERRCHLDFGLERWTGILYIIPISTTSGEKKDIQNNSFILN